MRDTVSAGAGGRAWHQELRPRSMAPPREPSGRGLCGLREQPQPIPAVPSLTASETRPTPVTGRQGRARKGAGTQQENPGLPSSTTLWGGSCKELGAVRRPQPTSLCTPHFTRQLSCPCVGPPIPAPLSPLPGCPGSAPSRCCRLLGATTAPLPSPSGLARPALTLMESA